MLWPCHLVLATTYYVSPNGSNLADGSLVTPWATPGYASRQLSPGDRLIILGGRYVLSEYDADIMIPPSGSIGAWITIEGEPGNRPELVGRNNLFSAAILSDVHYLHFKNLEITHDDQATGPDINFREAFDLGGSPCSNLVFEDLYIHHVDEFGINAGDIDQVLITNCRIEYCGFGALGGPSGVAGGWRNVCILESTLSYGGHYYQGGDGSTRPYERPDGFGIEESNGPILLQDCVLAHNYGDGLDSKSNNTEVSRCIIANNSCDGLKLWGGGSRVENTLIYGRGDGNPTTSPWSAIVIAASQSGQSFELVNVTVDDQLGNNYIMHVQYDDPESVDLLIQNCVFRGAGPNCPIWLRDNTSVTWDHNTFYFPQITEFIHQGSNSWTSANIGTLGIANTYEDPLFMAPAWGSDGDYQLQDLSPLIDTGEPVGAPSDDLTGTQRDAWPDRGCYEKTSCISNFFAQLFASFAAQQWPLTHDIMTYVSWLNACSE